MKNYSKAVEILETMKNDFPDLIADFVEQKACLYIFDLKDREKANAAIEEYRNINGIEKNTKALVLNILKNSMKWIDFIPSSNFRKSTINIKSELISNYPNPFNSETMIKFELKNESFLDLSIYNVLGQKIKTLINGTLNPGVHYNKWNAKNDQGIKVSSGIYIYTLKLNNKICHSKKLVLLN